jgi:RNA-binding protein 23/39
MSESIRDPNEQNPTPVVSLKRQRPDEKEEEEVVADNAEQLVDKKEGDSSKSEDSKKSSSAAAKNNTDSSSADEANQTSKNKGNGFNKSSSIKRCYQCGMPGHVKSACPEAADSRGKSSRVGDGRMSERHYANGDRNNDRNDRNDRERCMNELHERELLDLTRDARTVFVSQLVLRAQESDLKYYFEQVGRVAQVRLLSDKYGKSRGIGYVEFEDLETVPKALVLNGQKFCMKHSGCVCSGFPISIKPSQVEKNYAFMAEKEGGSSVSANIDKRVYILGLPFSVTEEELRKVVEAGNFGVVDRVSVITDRHGTSKRFGFISFRTIDAATAASLKLHDSEMVFPKTSTKQGKDGDGYSDAEDLLTAASSSSSTTTTKATKAESIICKVKAGRLNVMGLVVAHNGETFKFDGTMVQGKNGSTNSLESIGLTPQARAAMMMQLSKSTKASEMQLKNVLGLSSSAPQDSSFSSSSSSSSSSSISEADAKAAAAAAALAVASQYVAAPPSSAPPPPPSPAICLINMFITAEEDAKSGQGWDIELVDEVKDECSAFGKILHAACDKIENRVFLCFEKVEGALQAIALLNGRHFDGRVVQAIQFPLQLYVAKYPELLKIVT